jgi:predicted acylesterase/phospholipase RssA
MVEVLGRPRLGLALSSWGTRGYAHIGVLQALVGARGHYAKFITF